MDTRTCTDPRPLYCRLFSWYRRIKYLEGLKPPCVYSLVCSYFIYTIQEMILFLWKGFGPSPFWRNFYNKRSTWNSYYSSIGSLLSSFHTKTSLFKCSRDRFTYPTEAPWLSNLCRFLISSLLTYCSQTSPPAPQLEYPGTPVYFLNTK